MLFEDKKNFNDQIDAINLKSIKSIKFKCTIFITNSLYKFVSITPNSLTFLRLNLKDISCWLKMEATYPEIFMKRDQPD